MTSLYHGRMRRVHSSALSRIIELSHAALLAEADAPRRRRIA
ncbi:hypothetical protein [Nocardia alba]|nr:hypothetical protein [Nocardia alba]